MRCCNYHSVINFLYEQLLSRDFPLSPLTVLQRVKSAFNVSHSMRHEKNPFQFNDELTSDLDFGLMICTSDMLPGPSKVKLNFMSFVNNSIFF